MRFRTSVLCFTVVLFPNPTESFYGEVKKRFHPPSLSRGSRISEDKYQILPKLAHATFLSSLRRAYGSVEGMRLGRVRVGIQKDNGVHYVVGYMEEQPDGSRDLCPFIFAIPELEMDVRRIRIRVDKIKVDGVDQEYAYKYVIIPQKDEVMNALFFKPYPSNLIRYFLVEHPLVAKKLEPVTKSYFNGSIFTKSRFTKSVDPNQASSSQDFNPRDQAELHQRSSPRSVHQSQARNNLLTTNHAPMLLGQTGHLLDSYPPKEPDANGKQVEHWRIAK